MAFRDCRRFAGAGFSAGAEGGSEIMRVGFRDIVFRLARLLSAPGGLMDFIVYGGAVACKKGVRDAGGAFV